ncbi:MAG: hypothetical protein NVSMB28_26440 [Collimonas sp.]
MESINFLSALVILFGIAYSAVVEKENMPVIEKRKLAEEMFWMEQNGWGTVQRATHRVGETPDANALYR